MRRQGWFLKMAPHGGRRGLVFNRAQQDFKTSPETRVFSCVQRSAASEGALDVLVEMRRQNIQFSRETYTLGFAICYKLNRADSRAICGMLLEEIDLKGEHIPRQAFCFAAALAMKRNDVTKAKSIFSRIIDKDSRICNNLNIHIHMVSGAMEDVLKILEMSQESFTPHFVKRPEISQELLSSARELLKNNPMLKARYEAVYAKLEAAGQITALTLEDILCQTPHPRKQHSISLNHRKMNNRTFKPLQSTLLSE